GGLQPPGDGGLRLGRPSSRADESAVRSAHTDDDPGDVRNAPPLLRSYPVRASETSPLSPLHGSPALISLIFPVLSCVCLRILHGFEFPGYRLSVTNDR